MGEATYSAIKWHFCKPQAWIPCVVRLFSDTAPFAASLCGRKSSGLLKHHAHRLVTMNSLDGLAKQAGHRQDRDIGHRLFGGQRDRISHNNPGQGRRLEPLNGRANEQAVGGRRVNRLRSVAVHNIGC